MVFWIAVLLINSAVLVNKGNAEKSSFEPLSDELINYVNNKPGGTWKAARTTRFHNISDIRAVLGTYFEPASQKNSKRPMVTHAATNVALPTQFMAAEKWPNCTSIRLIRDQSNCGSCWAFGAVTAMSDRVCIASQQRLSDVELSALDLMSCCTRCGFGCVGGWIGEAWDYWRDHGIVTGGMYGTNETCRPYPFESCKHHSSGPDGCSRNPVYPSPHCEKRCIPEYHKQYDEDKYKGRNSYNLLANAEVIMKEIFINGPVEAGFNIYEDFFNYQSGVYQHVTGALSGGHAVRIVGWGEHEGLPYWRIANSWNENWGDGGFFNMIRGENHCGIESDVSAGLPADIEG